MRIAVVDGQGGGIGKALVEKMKKELPEGNDIIALGTNAAATMQMLKAGADEGATGENALVYNADRVDLIVGTIGIIAANSLMGEMSPRMAAAVAGSRAKKILIPLNRCGIEVAGVRSQSLPQQLDNVIDMIKETFKAEPD